MTKDIFKKLAHQAGCNARDLEVGAAFLGLAIVPVEPDTAMLEAGNRAHTGDPGSGFYFDTKAIYKAMINTATRDP